MGKTEDDFEEELALDIDDDVTDDDDLELDNDTS